MKSYLNIHKCKKCGKKRLGLACGKTPKCECKGTMVYVGYQNEKNSIEDIKLD